MMGFSKIKLDVNSHWGVLASFQFQHNYYKDKGCADFEVIPTQETLEFMKNYRMLFKTNKSGFKILHREGTTAMLLTDNDEVLDAKLSFIVKNGNNKFINFSNLPFLDSEAIYYFSNANGSLSKDKGKLLHKGDDVNVSDDSQLFMMPKLFNFTFTKPVKFSDLEITNCFKEKIKLKKARVNTHTDDIAITQHKIDLRGYPGGKYVLNAPKGGVKDFKFYATEETKLKCFGVIDLFLDKKVKKDFCLFNKNNVISQDFAVLFESRSTYWKYYVVDKNSQIKYRHHKIVSKEGDVEFSKAEKITLDNGMEVIQMVSKQPIAFNESQQNKFRLELSKNPEGKGNIFTINLPAAGINLIKPDRKTKKVFSEIFVYI